MRVFLDANVLFSASLLPHGNAPRLMEIGRAGGCVLLTSAHAVREAERNVGRKTPQALSRLGQLIQSIDVVSDALPADAIVWAGSYGLPPKDAPILAAAVVARADLLVTGDRRHFGQLFGSTLQGVRILSLTDGLAAVLAALDTSA
jgi:predicted nucleic acid-binding protein